MNHDLRRFCGVGTGVSMSAGIMGDVGSDCGASSACFFVKESSPTHHLGIRVEVKGIQ